MWLIILAIIYFMGVAVNVIVGFMEWDQTLLERERRSAAKLVFQSPIWPFIVLKLFVKTLQDMWEDYE